MGVKINSDFSVSFRGKDNDEFKKSLNNLADGVIEDEEEYVYYDEEDVDIYGTCFDLFKDWD